MSTSILTPARAAYYDRNASSYANQYSAGSVAPHAFVQRFTNTVASGKKLLVEGATVSLYRETAATTTAKTLATVQVNDGVYPINICGGFFYISGVGAPQVLILGSGPTVYAGQTISGYSQDLSTGGTITYEIDVKGTTYDA